jgi:predicted TIM-barrel fold metal-dependent hydrolase
MIVDVHSHIFPRVHGQIGTGPTRGLGYGRILFGDKEVQLMPPYSAETVYTDQMLVANMDWAGVDKVVLLQGTAYGECNDYVRKALAHYPDRLLAAAFFDPWAMDNRDFFQNIIDRPGFCAIKLECSVAAGLCGLHPEGRLDDPEIAWLWEEIDDRNLALVLDLGAIDSISYQTRAVHGIAEDHPQMPVVIAHLAQPSPAAEADPRLWRQWQEQIDLGLLANVYFDTAALPAYLPDEDFPYSSAARYLELAVGRIGAGKLMWGTDQPGLLGLLSYPQMVRMAHLHTAFLSNQERALVLGETAMNVYGRAG